MSQCLAHTRMGSLHPHFLDQEMTQESKNLAGVMQQVSAVAGIRAGDSTRRCGVGVGGGASKNRVGGGKVLPGHWG